MKKLRILSFITALVMILGCMPCGYSADDTLQIMFPADGSTVSYDTESIEVYIPEGKTPIKTMYTLDGKVIQSEGVNETVTVSSPLTVGRHFVEVTAIYEDGTAEKASSTFVAAILPAEDNIDFESFSPLADDIDGMTSTEAMEAFGCFNNISSKIDAKGTKVYIEKDETDNSYMTMRSTEVGTLTCHESYVHVWANTLEDGTHPSYSSGKLVLEFDAYLRKNWTTRVVAVPFNSSSKDWGSNNMIVDQNLGGIVMPDGTYKSLQGNYNWYHFKITYDLDNKVYYSTISDGDFVKPDSERIGEVNVAPIALPAPTSGSANVVYYRLGVGLNKSSEFRLDNIRTYTVGSYSGADEILFKAPSAGSDYIDAKENSVQRDVTELALGVKRILDSSSVNADNITVVAAGKELDISNVSYDESSGMITVLINNPEGISGNGDSYVKLSDDVCFKGGSKIGVDAVNPFNLASEGFGVKGVDFKCGSSYLFSSSQLRDGNSIKADITFDNATSDDVTLLAVLVIKKDSQILTMTPLDITVPKGETDYCVSVQAPAVESASDIKASLILVDSMANVNYIGSYYLI